MKTYFMGYFNMHLTHTHTRKPCPIEAHTRERHFMAEYLQLRLMRNKFRVWHYLPSPTQDWRPDSGHRKGHSGKLFHGRPSIHQGPAPTTHGAHRAQVAASRGRTERSCTARADRGHQWGHQDVSGSHVFLHADRTHVDSPTHRLPARVLSSPAGVYGSVSLDFRSKRQCSTA